MLTESPGSEGNVDWTELNWMYTSGSQSVISEPPAAASPGSLLEMQILGPCYRQAGLETLECGPSDMGFKSFKWFIDPLKCENPDLHCLWRRW